MIRDDYYDEEQGAWIFTKEMFSAPPYPDEELKNALTLVNQHEWIDTMDDDCYGRFQETVEEMIDTIDKEMELEQRD